MNVRSTSALELSLIDELGALGVIPWDVGIVLPFIQRMISALENADRAEVEREHLELVAEDAAGFAVVAIVGRPEMRVRVAACLFVTHTITHESRWME